MEEDKNDWFGHWQKTMGDKISLSEFKERFDKREYVEIVNVKSFQSDWFDFTSCADAITLIIMKREHGECYQKNSSVSGRSGSSGHSGSFEIVTKVKPYWSATLGLESYGLSKKEIRKILKNMPEFDKCVKLDDRLNLSFRSDCEKEVMHDMLDKLRVASTEKYSNETKTRVTTFYVNGMMLQYTANVKETISSVCEDIGYSFHAFDKEGNSMRSFNYGWVRG